MFSALSWITGCGEPAAMSWGGTQVVNNWGHHSTASGERKYLHLNSAQSWELGNKLKRMRTQVSEAKKEMSQGLGVPDIKSDEETGLKGWRHDLWTYSNNLTWFIRIWCIWLPRPRFPMDSSHVCPLACREAMESAPWWKPSQPENSEIV